MMNTDTDIMDQVRRFSREFVERHYPEEILYFDVAWEIYEKALKGDKNSGGTLTAKELRGPTVRDSRRFKTGLKGSDTIMAPRVLRAFHLLFCMAQGTESGSGERCKQEMLQLLLQERFSLEFSTEIVDFFIEKRDDQ